ncbi:MAG: hypothetical protein H8E57_00810 [Candidatus Cloacimonetes bacterium]|nr:hypothetical protein [Candidatus Cloacimonadota bacterium]
MKKFLLSVFILTSSLNLFSMVVDSTATMNNTELQELYNACNGSDPVIQEMYWDYQWRDGESYDDDFREETRDYHSINISSSYVELAFEGIIVA